jgi:transcriptional regulator with XRE-family HTH domain
MLHNDFAELLLRFRTRTVNNRRGISRANLAEQIGVAPATIQKWEYGINKPNKDNLKKISKIQKILNLNGYETGLLLNSAGILISDKDTPKIIFRSFFTKIIKNLYDNVSTYPIDILSIQSSWNYPPCRTTLLNKAKKYFSPENVLYIESPVSHSIKSSEFFHDLGEQCEFNNINSDFTFKKAMKKLRKQAGKLFLLIGGFDRSKKKFRKELANIIHLILDSNSDTEKLCVILCGSRKLNRLKFENGDLSLLNIAKVIRLPELDINDVQALIDFEFKKMKLDDNLAETFLKISGGNPQLLRQCLELKHENIDLPINKYEQKLLKYTYIWEKFIFTENVDREQIKKWLEIEDLGKAKIFFGDSLLGLLYWQNLIKIDENKHLRWRCEIIRQIGRNVLNNL